MSTPRIRLGQLLVDARMISQDSLDEVLASQRTDGRRLGTLLVERGHINEIQLTQILSHQLAVPWVSLLHIEFSRQLLDLVPREAAEKYCLVPIYVRHVRRQGDTLYVAMDDPTNEDALQECSSYSGLPVRAMIAPPSDIRSAIRVYYGATVRPAAPVSSHPPSTLPDLRAVAAAASMTDAPDIAVAEEEADAYLTAAELEEVTSRPTLESVPSDDLIEATRSEPPSEAAEPEPAPESGAREAPELGVPAPQPEEAPPTRPAGAPGLKPPMAALLGAVLGSSPPASPASIEAEPDAAARITPTEPMAPESDGVPSARIPAPRGRGRRRMIALTLLDGTTINLPARGRRAAAEEPAAVEPAPASEEPTLTARELVSALRAVAHGADASEVLGSDVRWEAMFAALLSLLLRKGLIADWEFVEELKKIRGDGLPTRP